MILKWAIGRSYPSHGLPRDAPERLDHPEYARDFEFRPLNPNNAWPSGHTSATISIAAALTAFYPDSVVVPLVGYPLSLAIGLGMVDGDHHWLSDVLGGALIGHAIGYSIGKSFRVRLDEHDPPRVPATAFTVQILPAVGAADTGVQVIGAF